MGADRRRDVLRDREGDQGLDRPRRSVATVWMAWTGGRLGTASRCVGQGLRARGGDRLHRLRVRCARVDGGGPLHQSREHAIGGTRAAARLDDSAAGADAAAARSRDRRPVGTIARRVAEESITSMAMRHSTWLLASVIAAAPAFAQRGVGLPVGQNLRDRPDQTADVVLDIDAAGAYALNGQPVGVAQLAQQLAPLMRSARDHVVYIRADAHLSAAVMNSATAIAGLAGACVASFVGTQERGTVSSVRGDAGQEAGNVRRAIDVQLSLPHPTLAMSARQQAQAIVLEVLPGPAYRINGEEVPAGNLQRRLLEIFNPRPLKVLFVRGNSGASYQDVFHAMDAARYAGVVDVAAAPPQLEIAPRLPTIDLTMRVTPRDDSIAEHT